MKYYIIAGEASGDLHGSNLMKAIKARDPEATFRFWGGDKMAEVGGTPVKHIKELAFMGFIRVLLNFRTIKRNISLCKKDLLHFNPDVLIPIDYAGFNLQIARFAKNQKIPVHYFISPKIWASRQGRIKHIKRNVDKMLVILPFEVDFYKKFDFPVDYVGNPILDAIENRAQKDQSFEDFISHNNLPNKPIVALLAGSRKQELERMLPKMLASSQHFTSHQFIVAGAPGLTPKDYQPYLEGYNIPIVYDQTYPLLQQSSAALVTSGTATLETGLFRVPQVVCYDTNLPDVLYKFGRKYLIKIPWVSLVNLVAGSEICKELIQVNFTTQILKDELSKILYNKEYQKTIQANYQTLWQKMGNTGASDKAAICILTALKQE